MRQRVVENERKYDKERYWSKRDNGLCTYHSCTKPADRNDRKVFVCCAEHREYFRKANQRERIRKKKRLARLQLQLSR